MSQSVFQLLFSTPMGWLVVFTVGFAVAMGIVLAYLFSKVSKVSKVSKKGQEKK